MAEEKKYTVRDLVNLLGGVGGVGKNELLSSILLNEGYQDLDEIDQIVDADMPYESKLKAILQNTNIVKELSKSNPAFLKRVAEADLKNKSIFDPVEMSLDNIAQALGTATALKKEDILKNNKAYRKADPVVMKNIAANYGWNYPEMLDAIRQAQTNQARQDLYEDTNILTKVMFPRASKAILEGRDPTTKEMTLDGIENALQLVPMGNVAKFLKLHPGTAIGASGLGRKVANGASSAGRYLVENASVPGIVEAADYAMTDEKDRDGIETLEKILQGTAINAAAGKAIPAMLSGVLGSPTIAKALDKVSKTGYNDYAQKAEYIRRVLSNPRAYKAEEVKNALNMQTILDNPKLFKGDNGASIFDYATNTRKARKSGLKNKADYEAELADAFGAEKDWAKAVKDKEKTYKDDPNAFTQYTEGNRSAVFPHNFVDPNKVATKDGVIRINDFKDIEDMPEWNIYPIHSKGKTVSKELSDIADAHNSKKFQYSTDDYDELVNDLLKDNQFVEAMRYRYGSPSGLVSMPTSWLTNKLGRSSWLNRQREAAKRYFGEEKPKKEKDSEKDEDEE